MKVFVYIATTQGPVAIQRITEEEPEIQSVICLNGTVEALPISSGYHAFVKKGTGIIHKDFGHGAFRIDIDGRVEQGNSWQLGIYLAHLCHQQGTLASGTPQVGDLVIWATGVVRSDKSLVAVSGIREKLQRSTQQLAQWQQQGIDVLCLMPADNHRQLPAEPHSEWSLPDALTIQGPDDLQQALDLIPSRPSANNTQTLVAPVDMTGGAGKGCQSVLARFTAGKVFALLVLLLGLAGIVVLYNDQQPADFNTTMAEQTQPEFEHLPDTQPVATLIKPPQLFAMTATGADSCVGEQQRVPLTLELGEFSEHPLGGLCQLLLVTEPPVTAVVIIALDSGGIPALSRDEAGWQIPRPNSGEVDRRYALVLLSDVETELATTRLKQRVAAVTKRGDFLSMGLLRQWLTAEGWQGQVYQHRLIAF